jgi:hypothetical protein
VPVLRLGVADDVVELFCLSSTSDNSTRFADVSSACCAHSVPAANSGRRKGVAARVGRGLYRALSRGCWGNTTARWRSAAPPGGTPVFGPVFGPASAGEAPSTTHTSLRNHPLPPTAAGGPELISPASGEHTAASPALCTWDRWGGLPLLPCLSKSQQTSQQTRQSHGMGA